MGKKMYELFSFRRLLQEKIVYEHKFVFLFFLSFFETFSTFFFFFDKFSFLVCLHWYCDQY